LDGPELRIVAGASVAVIAALIGGVVLHLNGSRHDSRVAAVSVDRIVPPMTAGKAVPIRVIVRKKRPPKKLFCVLAPGSASLPPGRLRGLAHHLRQYPDVTLARPTQKATAERLLATLRASALRWRIPREAAAAGFDLHTARRIAGDRTPHYLHAESRRFANDGRYLDPQRPEALIYANMPGRPLLLIGVMFSMPRGIHGPSPAGPIARWHFHLVCARGNLRGLKPLADGSCPRGETLREGSEMLHVWFTHDLRSAYAIHAPEPELCATNLLPHGYCTSGLHLRGM
jgi:hypothetical protein